MKRYFLVLLTSIFFLMGCESNNDDGLVEVHLTKSSDSKANVTIDSDAEDITKTIPIEFELGGSWQQLKTTHFVTKGFASLIEQGKVKIIATNDGSVKFEPL